MPDVLLITPPFTQLNTPYPATAYLKGFLNTEGIKSYSLVTSLLVGEFRRSRLDLAQD